MATVSRYTTSRGETRWRVRYRTPDRKQTDKRGFTRKKDAEDFLATVTVQMRSGEYVRPADGRRTVAELGEEWIGRQVHVKPAYREDLRSALRIHVLPRWGDVQVRSIRKTEVQSWVAGMTAGSEEEKRKPLSASVVKRALRVLHGILEDAVTDRLIAKNPAAGVKQPRKIAKPRNYLSSTQLVALADECGVVVVPRGRPSPLPADEREMYEAAARSRRALVLLLGYTGLRWGEATALRGRHVDVKRQRITVEKNVVWLLDGPAEGTPKSHERRTVPIPLFLVKILATELEQRGRDDLVFPAPEGGYLPQVGSDYGWFANAVKRAGIPRVTPHDLRHTAASLAVSAGANVKALQRMLGHASASMSLDVYADLFDSDLEDVSTRLDNLYAPDLSRASRQVLRLVAGESTA